MANCRARTRAMLRKVEIGDKSSRIVSPVSTLEEAVVTRH